MQWHETQSFTQPHRPVVCQRWEKGKGLGSCVALCALDTSYGLKQRQSQIRVCVKAALPGLGWQTVLWVKHSRVWLPGRDLCHSQVRTCRNAPGGQDVSANSIRSLERETLPGFVVMARKGSMVQWLDDVKVPFPAVRGWGRRSCTFPGGSCTHRSGQGCGHR